MTTDLRHTLADRADRAATPDLDEMLAAVRSEGDRLVRRRRSVRAAGGGSLVILALTGGLITAANVGSTDSAAPAGRPTVTATVTPSPTQDLDSLRSQAAHRAGRLVTAAPAPAGAPVSLGLLPSTYRFLAGSGPATTYGVPGEVAPSPNAYTGKLAVIVGERYDRDTLPTRIGAYPGEISAVPASDGDVQWVVRLLYSAKIDISIQVPRTAHLSRAQVRTMAATLDVRDVSQPVHG